MLGAFDPADRLRFFFSGIKTVFRYAFSKLLGAAAANAIAAATPRYDKSAASVKAVIAGFAAPGGSFKRDRGCLV
jgi:hypothetical protein